MTKIQNYLTAFFQSCFSLVKVILLSKFFIKLPHAKEKEESVILGTGPSLNASLKDDYDFITAPGRAITAVNTFCYSDYYQKLKPAYYVITAPEFYLEKTTDLHVAVRNKVFDILNTTTDWPMLLLMPAAAKKSPVLENVFASNPNIKLTFFNSTPIEGIKSVSHFFFGKNLGMPRPHNVLIPSIFLSLNMGYKKIYIFGADHSWHEEIKVDGENRATVNHQHFYENQPYVLPMYKLDGKEYYIHDIFRKLHFAFKGYFILKDYAASLGAEILNASAKSYIDAFSKIKLKG